MKMSKYLILILLAGCFIFTACRSDNVDIPKYIEFTASELCDSDSMLTKEQKLTKKKLIEVMCSNLIVKGDKVVVSISKEKFLSEGLPESYYNLLVREINSLNLALSQDTVSRQAFLKDFPVKMTQMRAKNAEVLIE